MLSKHPQRISNIPDQELKQAASVEHNLLLVKEDSIDGAILEYHANCYVHTGSHCRELARMIKQRHPEATRVAYRMVVAACHPTSSITTVFKYVTTPLD